MSWDFPANPNPGQVFAPNGVPWIWDGEKWTGGQNLRGFTGGDGKYDDKPHLYGRTYSWNNDGIERAFFAPETPTQDFVYTVPDGISLVRVNAVAMQSAAGAYGLCCRYSFDGSFFFNGSADYVNAGYVRCSGTASWANFGPTNTNVIWMCNTGTIGEQLPHVSEALFTVAVPTTAYYYRAAVQGVTYYTDAQYYEYELNTTAALLGVSTTANRLKALQFFLWNGSAKMNFAKGTFIEVEALG